MWGRKKQGRATKLQSQENNIHPTCRTDREAKTKMTVNPVLSLSARITVVYVPL